MLNFLHDNQSESSLKDEADYRCAFPLCAFARPGDGDGLTGSRAADGYSRSATRTTNEDRR